VALSFTINLASAGTGGNSPLTAGAGAAPSPSPFVGPPSPFPPPIEGRPYDIVPVEIAHPVPVPVTMVSGTGTEKPADDEDKAGNLFFLNEAAKIAAGSFQAVADASNALGAGMRALAGNDHMGLLNAGVDGAVNALKTIPIVGQVLAAGLEGLVAPIRAATAAVDAFVQRGKELEVYNAQLAAANIGADIRTLMADIKEANEIGPALAHLADAQSRADSEWREFWLPLKKIVVDTLSGMTEVGIGAIQAFNKTAEGVGAKVLEQGTAMDDFVRGTRLFLKTLPGEGTILDLAEHFAVRIVDEVKKQQEPEWDAMIEKQLQALANRAATMDPGPQPLKVGPLNIPLFNQN